MQGMEAFIFLLSKRCIHVEVVTSLDLNSFLVVFSRFTDFRGEIDVIYSDNATTFCAASSQLSDFLGSTEFHNALHKSDIDWIKILPHSPN